MDNWHNNEFNGINLIYEVFSGPQTEAEKRRLTEISVFRFEPETMLDGLLDEFLRLVDTCKTIPYVALTGAPRY